ncbi:MAG: hypothetical protein ACOVLG_12345 [Flavobacterium sp.]
MKSFFILAMFSIFFSCSAQNINRTLPVFSSHFTTQSHLVSVNGDCYTIWVGLFWLGDDGENTLITYGESTVGSGCRPNSNVTNENCDNIVYKGDYIVNSDSKNVKYCLIDCLKDDRIYNLYVSQRDKILADNRK